MDRTKNSKILGLGIFCLLSSLILDVKAQTTEEYYPAPILLTDNYFSHHILIAEKSTHSLYLYKNNDGAPELVKTYQMATGKKAGDKFFQGDYRTPEGVYHFSEFIPHDELLKKHGKQGEIYGVGAFVMNYPNPVDQRKGKTGGGIWMHSTNDETRIDKGLDSRGCIVSANVNLIDVSQYLELNKTSVIVVDELFYLPKKTWTEKKQKITNLVEQWRKSWEQEDLKAYLSFYHPTEFHDSSRGGHKAWSDYKKAVFATPGKPSIGVEDLSIFEASDYMIVTFKQNYSSNTIADLGKKSLYLKKDEYYNWKIVSEIWTKHGIDEVVEGNHTIAFQPSLRFFKSRVPSQIMSIQAEYSDVGNNE